MDGADPIWGHAPDPPPPQPPLAFRDPSTLQGRPIAEREWVVQQWLPRAVVSMNYAAGGEGKTLLAQQLMTSCATGVPWVGLPVERVRSMAMFCEDDAAEIQRRQDNINRAYGIEFRDLADMRWTCPVGDDNTLLRFERDGSPIFTDRFEDFRVQALAFQPGLVVLDVAADLFGGSENDRQQVSTFLKFGLGSLARDLNAAVLLNAHPSRAGINSGEIDGGSTAWTGGARSRWSMATPGNDDGEPVDFNARILTKRKANYSTRGDEIRLRLQDGVLYRDDGLGSGVVAGIAKRNCQDAFLDILDKLEPAGLHVSASPNSGNYAPRYFSKRPDRQGFSKREFEAAMHALFAVGSISNGSYGPPSSGTKRIVKTLQPTDISTSTVLDGHA